MPSRQLPPLCCESCILTPCGCSRFSVRPTVVMSTLVNRLASKSDEHLDGGERFNGLATLPLGLLRWATANGFAWPPHRRGVSIVNDLLLSGAFQGVRWVCDAGLKCAFRDPMLQWAWAMVPVASELPEYRSMLTWLMAHGFEPDDEYDR